TVFLSILARYLEVKAEAGELDRMYAYAQASLGRYAEWMLANESPYFDHPEKLEFPTETWPAQDIRKANVLRLAAGHTDDPMRSRLLRRAEALADRGWSDLLRLESRTVTLATALILIEGLKDSQFRCLDVKGAPRPAER